MTKNPNHPMIGKRVQVPAYTDAWMRGARFGVITQVFVRPEWVQCQVKLDAGYSLRCALDDCVEVG